MFRALDLGRRRFKLTFRWTVTENIEYSTIAMHIDQAAVLKNQLASTSRRTPFPESSRPSALIAKPPHRKVRPVAKSPPHNTPITEHLAYLLAQASREINRQLEARLRQEGVPVEQWRILKVLSDGNGHSMGDLAEVVLLNHPTLTKMIDRMVSDAMVYRAQDLDDRRKVLMYISDRGRELTRRLNSLAQSQETHIVANYGNRATADLKRLLETLIDVAS
jgi:MarR family transcriptional regulator, organic hydroperoxide resistance regulator